VSGHPSAAGRAQDRESPPAKDRRSTTEPTPPTADVERRLSWLPGELPDYALTTDVYYIVERRCPPSKNWLEIASDVRETSYTMNDYRPEKDYMFRIRATNEYGISDPSLSATVFSKLAGARCMSLRPV